jgi:hypothetical protein
MAKAKGPAKKNGPAKGEGGAPPFEYDEKIADEICFLISTTKDGIDKILKVKDYFPGKMTFYKWIFSVSDFADKYRQAKEHQQDILVESQKEELEWARNYTYVDAQGNSRIDSGAVALAKLACDTIKWDASKKAPKKYGTQDNKSINVNLHEARLEHIGND